MRGTRSTNRMRPDGIHVSDPASQPIVEVPGLDPNHSRVRRRSRSSSEVSYMEEANR